MEICNEIITYSNWCTTVVEKHIWDATSETPIWHLQLVEAPIFSLSFLACQVRQPYTLSNEQPENGAIVTPPHSIWRRKKLSFQTPPNLPPGSFALIVFGVMLVILARKDDDRRSCLRFFSPELQASTKNYQRPRKDSAGGAKIRFPTRQRQFLGIAYLEFPRKPLSCQGQLRLWKWRRHTPSQDRPERNNLQEHRNIHRLVGVWLNLHLQEDQYTDQDPYCSRPHPKEEGKLR